jgi:hypothetical protein
MEYLSRAYRLAEERDYLRYPEVIALEKEVPDWFQRLGNPAGIADFEARRGVRLPAALREFYGCIPLASVIEACFDGEVFLRNMDDSDPPPLVNWTTSRHLVFSFHCHSGMVAAASLNGEDPPVASGFEQEPEPINKATVTFSAWMFQVVDGYEKVLDYWQGVYEKCAADPTEARRLGGVEWIRHMVGMSGRLGKPPA